MSMHHVHYHRSWQSGGTALIIVGAVFLGCLVLSLKQYIWEKDFIGIILLSVISLIFFTAGVFVKWWARKTGRK